jgi:hypothetical protein
MMGVAGILGGALLSAIHGATVINTIYQDGGAYTTFRIIHTTYLSALGPISYRHFMQKEKTDDIFPIVTL